MVERGQKGKTEKEKIVLVFRMEINYSFVLSPQNDIYTN
jgi:hypothetical protein